MEHEDINTEIYIREKGNICYKQMMKEFLWYLHRDSTKTMNDQMFQLHRSQCQPVNKLNF